ncbi:MAG: DUF4276 family protein [Candidatus Magnetobacterium sp. LHC-1]|uniref:DUF4276 family protein n=1 Tax=Candidatus Magnetobacterium casense TaxID=1455061 RepID=A0ABS6RX45_9BACT|nr:DUF4276 family protein [Candidatus Magnetobacterium casensis]MBF0607003.1 DUF4276 family protein [Nitrospirota bacterium]MBV6340368.1 DUF4276 family protein [Candidatus Magnetobacterium casensis]
MIKIAFFVEGQTERIFVEKFLDEYISLNKCELIVQKYIGNNKSVKRIFEKKNPYAKFYVLIHEVGNDEKVNITIRENAEVMIKSSDYSYIIGLRDLYPKSRQERDRVIKAFYKLFDKFDYSHKIKYILAIMEIEAWFLLDKDFFTKMTDNPQEVTKILDKKNTEEYNHPAKVIDKIYRLLGKEYNKHEDDSYNITYNLDYNFLCSDEVKARSDSWHCFVQCVDDCFR